MLSLISYLEKALSCILNGIFSTDYCFVSIVWENIILYVFLTKVNVFQPLTLIKMFALHLIVLKNTC